MSWLGKNKPNWASPKYSYIDKKIKWTLVRANKHCCNVTMHEPLISGFVTVVRVVFVRIFDFRSMTSHAQRGPRRQRNLIEKLVYHVHYHEMKRTVQYQFHYYLYLQIIIVFCAITVDSYFKYFSEFSPELHYTSSAGVPSTPDPPFLVKATACSLQLSWKKPNTNGGTWKSIQYIQYALN